MICGWVGMMGSGKSISLVKQIIDIIAKNPQTKIYSNMHLNIPYTRLTLEILMEYKQDHKKFDNCIIVIDEIHIFMDSRRSMSNRNIGIASLLVMSRKLSLKLFWTSQQEHQVDRRLKSNTDITTFCNSYMVQDILIVENKMITMDGRVYNKRFIGNKYFNKYDTNEIISLE